MIFFPWLSANEISSLTCSDPTEAGERTTRKLGACCEGGLDEVVPRLTSGDVKLIHPDVRTGRSEILGKLQRELRILTSVAEEGFGRLRGHDSAL